MRNTWRRARLFKEFAKANAKFEVKAAAFEGELIPASQIPTAWHSADLRRSNCTPDGNHEKASAGNWFALWLLYAMRKKRLIAVVSYKALAYV